MASQERLRLGLKVIAAISLVGAAITWARGEPRRALMIVVVALFFLVTALLMKPSR
jgi:hypothetical protein